MQKKPGKKKRILVIDDEVGFTRLLKLSLERTGDYEVRVENGGTGALAAACEFKPDLILLDYRMPDMHGEDVATLLRAEESVKETPVVFLTAMASRQVKVTEPQLSKPATIDEIIACIEQHLR